jgi:hypothetical protein
MIKMATFRLCGTLIDSSNTKTLCFANTQQQQKRSISRLNGHLNVNIGFTVKLRIATLHLHS